MDSVRKVSDGVGKVSDGVRKVSYGIKKSSDGARKVSDGARVYFKRLLPRPEYILKDSWQEAYVIHMENKDLHVAIVFSPICGPMTNMRSKHKYFNKSS